MNRSLLTALVAHLALTTGVLAEERVLWSWDFEQVIRGGVAEPADAGDTIVPEDRQPGPLVADRSGNENHLQAGRADGEPSAFVDAAAPGSSGSLSLHLRGQPYRASLDRAAAYADVRGSWTIAATIKLGTLEHDQVIVAKRGTRAGPNGRDGNDLAIGFDASAKRLYVEVGGTRLQSTFSAERDQWLRVSASAVHEPAAGQSEVSVSVTPAGEGIDGAPVAKAIYGGAALPRGAAEWVVGPEATDLLIDDITLRGEPLPLEPGQNPILRDTFTADPAAMVHDGKVYLYVGHDAAQPGQFFVIPGWYCYVSSDLKTWEKHDGYVMKPEQFSFGRPNVAWAAHMTERDGQFYFYTTLRQRDNDEHAIGVAVSDSPTGPFEDARGTPLITDGMTADSSRPNADIDPAVFVDDDGQAYLWWGNGDCYYAKLKPNMTELDGGIVKLDLQHYAEGPWVFRRGELYYNVYAADVPGTQPEQIAYATSPSVTGPWTYRGLVTGPAEIGFTIHPAVIEFDGEWYFFFHDGAQSINGLPGGDVRRSVRLERLHFDEDGMIEFVDQTLAGIAGPAPVIDR